MIQIAVCDDLSDQLQQINGMVDTYFKEKSDVSYVCRTFDNPFIFLETVEAQCPYDILLLDICMPGILGTDIAEIVRKQQDYTEIIFITTSKEFAIEAYALRATHYLVKPFSNQDFYEAMDRALDHITIKNNCKLIVKLDKSMYAININDIIYIESRGHFQYVHLKDGRSLQARETLTWFLKELDNLSEDQFISPYKGYVVNQEAIQFIRGDRIRLREGHDIPIRNGTTVMIERQFFDYMFNKSKK